MYLAGVSTRVVAALSLSLSLGGKDNCHMCIHTVRTREVITHADV